MSRIDAPLPSAEGIDAAMSAFARISQELLASYDALARRAEHVEQELSRANQELADRVAELDGVKRHVEAILDSLPTGVVVRDPDGRIVRANGAAARIAGARADALVGEREIAGLPPLAGDSTEWSEHELARGDGMRAVLARRRSLVTTPDAGTLGSVEILEDRTELARVTERMHQQQKMAALGTMAGGIAHEIRNPLNAVKGFASLLLRELSSDTKLGRWASRIQEGASEADAIIASLLSFSQPERLRLELVDGPALAADAIALVRDALGALAPRWSIECACRPIAFRADRIQLRQALRNLIANAIDAQPAGGHVRVEIAPNGDEVEITVGDAGPGIAPEIARKVVEPFFTTRAEGTGLGLAIVHTIVQLHGGRLEIAAERCPLGGALVRLRLPLGSPH